MINKNAQLHPEIFSEQKDKKPTRDGFGHGVVALGKENPDVVVLCADLAESTRAEWFQKEFPERYVELGVAEQNLATVASGMAAVGKIPFIASYAAFSPGRSYEQVRTTIALNEQPVKIAGMHAGISVGPDGATHQMLEDIGLMRMLPHMTVIVPGDAEEAKKATIAAGRSSGPVYIRYGRSATPFFTTPDTPFEIGKALLLWKGEAPQVLILSTGSLSHRALLVARALDAEGVFSSVVHVATVKPLDKETILREAQHATLVVTIEEHQVHGGFGSAVAELLSEALPKRMVFFGVHDQFGQSGDTEELYEAYGLSVSHMTEKIRGAIG